MVKPSLSSTLESNSLAAESVESNLLDEDATLLESKDSRNGAANRITAAAAPTLPDDPVVTIEATRSWLSQGFKELWAYRELLYFLTWRDIKVRYKQTVLGASWAILQPLVAMLIFTVFGQLAGLDKRTAPVPYPIYIYTGLLAWTFFASMVNNSGNSLVGSTNLVTKIYFPRLIIPLAAVGVGLTDFCMATMVLLVMMLYYGTPVTAQLLMVPLFLAGTILAGSGIGILLSALTVSYRDFKYVIPFLIQTWLFVTPVMYPTSIVPEKWRWLLAFNPMAGMVDGFRAAFLARPFDWSYMGTSLAVALLFFIVGTTYFSKVERRFADVI